MKWNEECQECKECKACKRRFVMSPHNPSTQDETLGKVLLLVFIVLILGLALKRYFNIEY